MTTLEQLYRVGSDFHMMWMPRLCSVAFCSLGRFLHQGKVYLLFEKFHRIGGGDADECLMPELAVHVNVERLMGDKYFASGIELILNTCDNK